MMLAATALDLWLDAQFGAFGPLILVGRARGAARRRWPLPIAAAQARGSVRQADGAKPPVRRARIARDRPCAAARRRQAREDTRPSSSRRTRRNISAVRLKLLQAGYRGRKSPVRIYHFAQFALGLGLLVLGGLWALVQGRPPASRRSQTLIMAAAGPRRRRLHGAEILGHPPPCRPVRRRSPTAFPTRST